MNQALFYSYCSDAAIFLILILPYFSDIPGWQRTVRSSKARHGLRCCMIPAAVEETSREEEDDDAAAAAASAFRSPSRSDGLSRLVRTHVTRKKRE